MAGFSKVLFLGSLAAFCAAGADALGAEEKAASAEELFYKKVKPLLATYCYDCHGENKKKGDVDLSRFKRFSDVESEKEEWAMVLEVFQAGDMPPEDEPRPNEEEAKLLSGWLSSLSKFEIDCGQLATDTTQKFYQGYVMSRRLTKREYDNVARDLIGVDVKPGSILPNDGAGGEGFDNNGSTLYSSSLAIEKYLEAADIILDTVLPEFPGALSKEEMAARRKILAPASGSGIWHREAAARAVGAFARKAYRRPVSDTEVERLLGMFDRSWDRGDGFDASLRLALKAVLISPHFLFLSEPEPEAKGVQPLGAITLASRLSFFIWASAPDEELMRLAESGALLDETIYRDQIRRMLFDGRSRALGERFAMQWLGLEHFDTGTGPDQKRFPEFDEELAESMKEEVVTFFNYVIREDRSLEELIDSDYSFVNDRLAALYELDGVEGRALQRVTFDNRNRGGILGMAGIHAANSYPLRTSPVLRGKWVLEVLLGGRMNPPPDDVPALEEDGDRITAVSMREELEAHRKNGECAVCHNKMDPLGFGLENFDSLGRWRSDAGGEPIDASGVLPTGEAFDGPAGLKDILLNQKDRVARHFVKKMAGYGLGRELNRFDECLVRDALSVLENQDYRLSSVVETIAMSLPFRYRYYTDNTEIENNEEVANR